MILELDDARLLAFAQTLLDKALQRGVYSVSGDEIERFLLEEIRKSLADSLCQIDLQILVRETAARMVKGLVEECVSERLRRLIKEEVKKQQQDGTLLNK